MDDFEQLRTVSAKSLSNKSQLMFRNEHNGHIDYSILLKKAYDKE